jgi:hypothetical protein
MPSRGQRFRGLQFLRRVTTGPLERSSCRIHLRGRCRDEVTDVASTPAAGGCADGVPSREVHVSKKSIVFLPSSLLRSRSLFWLRERRGESNAQVQDLNESDRVPAGVDYLSESWAKSTTQTEDSHWSANGRAETRRTKPDAGLSRSREPELAWWTTSSMALGDDTGSAATGFLVIGPPDRRLGAFVEKAASVPGRRVKTDTNRDSRTNWAPTCLCHVEVDVRGRSGSNRWLLRADVEDGRSH